MTSKLSFIMRSLKLINLSEAIMAQAAMNVNNIATSSQKKAYSVSIKGLIAHLVDVLFGKDQTVSAQYTSELSEHLQKDLGLYR